MLFDLQRTPFDLNWRMFGIPVRVHPSFWLVAALFSWPWVELGFGYFFIAVGCIFLSVLLHELGHALTFRYYRTYSSILLYSFGGLAMPEGGRLPYRSQRIIVSLAGPFANFLLLGLVWGSNYVQPWAGPIGSYTGLLYFYLFRVNLFLGLVNLLPVWPLDGGQVSRELWTKYRPYTGVVNSLQMSLVVAITIAVYAIACEFNAIPPGWMVWWLRLGLFAGILFALLAVQNYMDLQNQRRAGAYDDNRAPWER